MKEWASLIAHAIVGWIVCGATVAIGRQLVALDAALLIHAVVAPVAFALLTWHQFRWYPKSSPAVTALAMFVVVVGLDALVVAPVFEHSYAMFTSVIGTWFPFASIFVASYVVGLASRRGEGAH